MHETPIVKQAFILFGWRHYIWRHCSSQPISLKRTRWWIPISIYGSGGFDVTVHPNQSALSAWAGGIPISIYGSGRFDVTVHPNQSALSICAGGFQFPYMGLVDSRRESILAGSRFSPRETARIDQSQGPWTIAIIYGIDQRIFFSPIWV